MPRTFDRRFAARFAGPLLFSALLLVAATRPTTVSPSHEPPASQQAPTSQPAETVRERLASLAKIPAKEQKQQDRAERCALDFCVALGEASEARTTPLVDVVGYQPLPISGELPDPPYRPIPPKDLAKRIGARTPAGILDKDMTYFTLKRGGEVRELFPAIAEWMGPADWALVVNPFGDAQWPPDTRCVVVRVRGPRAVVIGGNLVE